MIGVVTSLTVCLSACVDTTSKPSPMTADPHAVATLAQALEPHVPGFGGCMAYQSTLRLTPAQTALLQSDATPSGPDLTAIGAAYDNCMSGSDMVRTFFKAFRTAGKDGQVFSFTDSELECAVAQGVRDPRFKSPSSIMSAGAANPQTSLVKALSPFLSKCISRESVVSSITAIWTAQNGLSPGMIECAVGRLVDQMGGAEKTMNALFAGRGSPEGAQFVFVSASVGRACAAAGVR